MRLFLRFHTFSKIYDPIVPAFLIRLHSHTFAPSHKNTAHAHTQFGPENVAPHVFGPHISINFLFGFSTRFSAPSPFVHRRCRAETETETETDFCQQWSTFPGGFSELARTFISGDSGLLSSYRENVVEKGGGKSCAE